MQQCWLKNEVISYHHKPPQPPPLTVISSTTTIVEIGIIGDRVCLFGGCGSCSFGGGGGVVRCGGAPTSSVDG